MNGTGNRWGSRGTLVLACVTLLLLGCSQEGADWKQASTANSIEAYQVFLKQHPHAAQAAQAQARLAQLNEQRDWQIAAAANSRDAYQQFLAQHPASQWAQEARIRIENFAQVGVSGGVPPPGAASATTASGGAGPSSGAGEPTAGAAVSGVPAASGSGAGAPLAAAPGAGESAAPPASRTGTAGHHPSTHLLARHSRAAAHTRAVRLSRAGTGGRTVQLGAYRTRARAQLEWKQLAARFATLRALRPRYVAVRSRGERLYRLQVHLATPAAASGLCATLKRHARACVRVNA